MSTEEEFTQFVREAEPRLRQALVATYGPEDARDAVADALAYAWQHWSRVRRMDNPAGYVYRVATSRTPKRRRPPTFPVPDKTRMPEVEPRLAEALAQLSDKQRVAVFLVHGCGWSHPEVADFLRVSVSTLRNHLARGLTRLRSVLEVCLDAQG